jgi:hypothetical protein
MSRPLPLLVMPQAIFRAHRPPGYPGAAPGGNRP